MRTTNWRRTQTWMVMMALSGGACQPSQSDPEPEPLQSDEAFAVVTLVQGPEGGNAVVLVDDLLSPDPLDLSTALTVPVGEVVGSPFESDVLFALSGESPRLTRFRVTQEGRFEEETTLAFDDLLTPTRLFSSKNFSFVSIDKAYLFDPFAGEMLLINPQTMTLESRTEVDRTLVPGPGLFPVIGNDPVVLEDGRLVFTVGFANSTLDVVSPTSLIIVLNTATDSIDNIVATDGCGYLIHARQTADGSVLMGTGLFSTAVEIASMGARAGQSCVARLNVDDLSVQPTAVSATFDPASGSFVFVSDNQAFVRVLDTTSLPAGVSLTTQELNAGSHWQWGFIDDLSTGASPRIIDERLGTGVVGTYEVNGRRFVVDRAQDFTEARVSELGPDGVITPGLTTAQNIINLIPLSFGQDTDSVE